MYACHRHLGPYVGIAELLGPQTAEIGERLPGALHRQAARSPRSKVMSENATQTSARPLRHNATPTRIWLLVGVEGRVLMLIGVVSDLLKRCLAVSAR